MILLDTEIDRDDRIADRERCLIAHVHGLLVMHGMSGIWARIAARAVFVGAMFEWSHDARGRVLVFTPIGELVARDLIDTLTQPGQPTSKKRRQIEQTLDLAGYSARADLQMDDSRWSDAR